MRRLHVLNARSRPSAALHNGGSINVDFVNKLSKKDAVSNSGNDNMQKEQGRAMTQWNMHAST